MKVLLDKVSRLHTRSDPLTIFSVIWAVYCLFHMHYDSSNSIANRLPILIFSILVLARPGVPLLLGLLSGAMVFEHWMGMPTGSNHTLLSFLLNSMICITVAVQAIVKRGLPDDAAEAFKTFAPAGRALLLTMYFFGVFQKINTDFLNPDSSCASALVSYFVFLPPDVHLERWWLYMASYGTLIIETAIAIMLLVPRTRYWAVCAGILFHFLISLSAYRNYIPFTMFSMGLHMLFLDGGMLERFRQSPWWKILKDKNFLPIRIAGIIFAACMFALYANAATIELDPARSIVIWIPFGALLSLAVLMYDYPGRGQSSSNTTAGLVSRSGRAEKVAFLFVCGVFFLSCFSPYVGLKTGQSIAMFSNLHTENGISNHLIFRKPIPLFDYTSHSVEIVSFSDLNTPLINFPSPDVLMSRYAFEDFMSRHPEMKVTYISDGETHTLDGLTPEQIAAWTKNPIARKFMIFEPINAQQPKTCFESFDRYRLEYMPQKNRWFKKAEAPAAAEASPEVK